MKQQLITAQALWKGYDPTNIPFNETVLREEVTERYTIKHLYFNGEITADGRTRIYARLYTPASIPNGASIVMMNDVETPFDSTYINLFTECGYTVLALDYGGLKPGSGLVTIYPKSLEKANYFTPAHDFLKLTNTPRTSSWYVYACVMMRGFAYLKTLPGLEPNRICLFGVRTGAFQVIKAAYVLPDAACAVSLFNGSYVEGMDLNSNSAMIYNTCLRQLAYAPLVRTPFYILESSNNHENSLFSSSALAAAGSDKCRIYVAEHSDNNLDSDQRRSLLAFVNRGCFSETPVTKAPELTALCSDRALYYEVKVDDAANLRDVSLYYFFGDERGQYRNWRKVPLERVSESEYIVKADVYKLNEETSAFVSARYNDGPTVSSPIVTKTPRLMGVSAKEVSRTRLVYDTDMGTDDWLITKVLDEEGEISIVEVGGGIKGVTSSVNTLTTLKIGDLSSSGDRDSLLQLHIYSFGLQSLDIEVTCKTERGYIKYSTMSRPEAYEEWTKINLAHSEFKSEFGPMPGWDSAVSLTISSENTLLINSILWI